MNYSKQREAILDFLCSTYSHPCADEIYKNVREVYPNISLGTVYRNLSRLAECGMILKIDTGSGKEHYDATVKDHYHFVCKTCDRVHDVDIPAIMGINEQVAKSLNVTVENNAMLFFGKCKDCK